MPLVDSLASTGFKITATFTLDHFGHQLTTPNIELLHGSRYFILECINQRFIIHSKFFCVCLCFQVAPYLQHLCDATSIDGYQCNPPNSGSVSNSTLSGNCSGFPTHNDLHHIVIDSTISNRAYFDTGSCAEIPFIQKVNVVKAYNISSATALVNNIQKEDFGVDNFGSPVYSMFKNFKSCPRAAVGVQKKLYTPWWKATLSTDFKTSKLP